MAFPLAAMAIAIIALNQAYQKAGAFRLAGQIILAAQCELEL
jgi:tellurite resistance protein TehA-like permease